MKKYFVLLFLIIVSLCGLIGCEGCGNEAETGSETVYIEKPTVSSDLVYNGGKQFAPIAKNDNYTIIDNGNTDVGEYQVLIKLKSGAEWTDNTTASVILTYRIIKADNSWTTAPGEINVDYGDIFVSPLKAKFGLVEYTFYDGETEYKTMPEGVGEYEYIAYVNGNDNYSDLITEKKVLRINKQTNNYFTAPLQDFDMEFGGEYADKAEAYLGELTFVWYDSSNNKLAGEPQSIGRYYLQAVVSDTKNYVGITSEKVNVNIIQATNNWKYMPSVSNAVYGEEINVFAQPKFGENAMTYKWYDNNDNELSLSDFPWSAGRYYLTISIAETANYSALKSDKLYFEIEHKQVDCTFKGMFRSTAGSPVDLNEITADNITKLSVDGVTTINYTNGDNFTDELTDKGRITLYAYGKNAVYAIDMLFVSYAFSQADVSTIWSKINENPDGYYVLDEDIDFIGHTLDKDGAGYKPASTTSDRVCAVYKEFTGTLDGNGHSLLNLNIKSSAANHTTISVFGKVSGTIKNVYVDMNDITETDKCGSRSFTYRLLSNALIDNVFMAYTLQKYTLLNSSTYYEGGAITAYMEEGSKITNTIIYLTYMTDIENVSTFGALAGGTSYQDAYAGLNTNYIISQGTYVRHIGMKDWATNNVFRTYSAFMNGISKLPDTFGAVYSIEGSDLYFGGKKVFPIDNGWMLNPSTKDIPLGEEFAINGRAEYGEYGYKWYNENGVEINSVPSEMGRYGIRLYVNGTAEYKALESDIMYFNIIGAINPIEGEYVIDLSNSEHVDFVKLVNKDVAYIGYTFESEEKIEYKDDYIFDAVSCNVRGLKNFYVYTKSAEKFVMKVWFVDKAFGQSDVSTIWTDINAKPSGYYILSENMDFSGNGITKNPGAFGPKSENTSASSGNSAVYREFSGTFNGRGYGFYNLEMESTYEGNSCISVFGNVSGVICNLYVELIDVTGTGYSGSRSLAFKVSGSKASLNNIYLDLTMQRYDLGDSTNYYSAGGLVTVLDTNNVRNNIIVLKMVNTDKYEEYAKRGIKASLGGIAGQTSGRITVEPDSLSTNIMITELIYKSMVGRNSEWAKNSIYGSVNEFLNSVSGLPDGFSEYWVLIEKTLKFGGKTILPETNYWINELNVKNVFEGEPITVYAKAKYGQTKYEFYTENNVKLEAVPTAVGTYKVKAYVNEGVNYTGLDSVVVFKIKRNSAVEFTVNDIELRLDKAAETTKNLVYSLKVDGNNVVDAVFDIIADDPSLISVSGNTITGIKGGKTIITVRYIIDDDYYEATSSITVITYGFTQANVVDKKSTHTDYVKTQEIWNIINDDPSGYYVLDGDLDFSACSNVLYNSVENYAINQKGILTEWQHRVPEFSGVFDGKGHSITGLTMYGTNNGSSASLFGAVSGTICNIYIEITDTTEAAKALGCRTFIMRALVGANINNNYIKMTIENYNNDGSVYNLGTGALIGLVNDNDGDLIIRNNVAQVVVENAITETLGRYSGGIASYAYKKTLVDQIYADRNYVISGFVVRLVSAPNNIENVNDGENCYANDMAFGSVADFDAYNGWSEYWNVSDGVVSFGGRAL